MHIAAIIGLWEVLSVSHTFPGADVGVWMRGVTRSVVAEGNHYARATIDIRKVGGSKLTDYRHVSGLSLDQAVSNDGSLAVPRYTVGEKVIWQCRRTKGTSEIRIVAVYREAENPRLYAQADDFVGHLSTIRCDPDGVLPGVRVGEFAVAENPFHGWVVTRGICAAKPADAVLQRLLLLTRTPPRAKMVLDRELTSRQGVAWTASSVRRRWLEEAVGTGAQQEGIEDLFSDIGNWRSQFTRGTPDATLHRLLVAGLSNTRLDIPTKVLQLGAIDPRFAHTPEITDAVIRAMQHYTDVGLSAKSVALLSRIAEHRRTLGLVPLTIPQRQSLREFLPKLFDDASSLTVQRLLKE